MSEIKILDITVDKDKAEDGAYELLQQLRPEWKKEDIAMKVK